MSYIWKHIICIIIILYHPLSTSQSERIAMIPSPLTADNSSKHSCWLWIYVSCLYLALQGYPTHFIVMYMYRIDHRPQSSYAAVINTKLPVLKIYVVVAYLLSCMYIMIPHHTNLSILSGNKIQPTYFCVYSTNVHIRTDRSYKLLQIVHHIFLSFFDVILIWTCMVTRT